MAISALVVLQLVQTLATLYLPTLNADIIDKGVITGDTSYIMRTGGIMLAITLVQITCAIGAVYFGATTAMALGRDIRRGVFQRVQEFSAREVGRFGTPSLITRTTNDVQQVQMLAVMTFTLLVAAPITCVGGHHPGAQPGRAAVLAAAGGGARAGRHRQPDHRQDAAAVPADADRIDGINRVLREQITGVRVIRAFVRDPQERDRFGAANGDLYDASAAASAG